jgi:hypothetical protein
MTRALWAAATFAIGVGCAGPGTPIPVRGNVEPLVGEWRGDYSSVQTGRVGSILFTLRAGTDTASGDILMLPANVDPPTAMPRDADPARPSARLLRVSFVRCEGKAVTGWIEPYPDPDTGEKVFTTFDGVLEDGTINGTYVSYTELSGRRSTGKWQVKRKA